MTRRFPAIATLVIGVVFTVVGCGGNSGEPTGAPTPPPPIVTPPATTPSIASLYCGGVSSRSEVQARIGVPFGYSTTGGTSNIYAPKVGSQTGGCPTVIVLPPGCSQLPEVTWVGPWLAAQGYIVMVASAEIIGVNNLPFCAAVASAALDFLRSPENPFRAVTDTGRAGAIGYSQAGRVLVRVQHQDTRFNAIVAWDNLTKSDLADQGSPSCAPDPGVSIAPRAPALGLASEQCNVAELGIEAKKTGFASWRAGVVPAMEVVFAGADHNAFAGGANPSAPFIAYYTQHWFDRWLKADTTATARLLTPSVNPGQGATPVDRRTLLSAVWRSAAFLDGHDCADLRTSCP